MSTDRRRGASLALTLLCAVLPACDDAPAAADAGVDAPSIDVPPVDVPSVDTPPIDAPEVAVVDAGEDAPDAPPPRDVQLPPLTGTIRDVQHVVIFTQENRSFDHYLGALRGVRGFEDPAALRLRSGVSVLHQPNGSGELLPYHTSFGCIPDVAHDWASGHTAWHGGDWDRWVPAKGPVALSAYAREDLSLYYALADAYTVMDAYHCSVVGPTNPNRLYLMTGTIDTAGVGGGPVIDNHEPSAGFTWTTYPERLQQAGVSWRVYQAFDNYDDNALAWFAAFKSARAGDPLYERGMRRATNVASAFRDDVMSGQLPRVSWIIAPTAQSEHPPYSLSLGQSLTQQIISAINEDPAVARSTVLFINYDENGGFYDHVAPPTPPANTPDEFVSGAPIGLGNRVPMIVVSPWSRGGFVDSEVADHTSVLRFLELWTGVREPNISAWRRQVVGDLTSAFDFAHPDFTLPTLPTITGASCTIRTPTPPATQSVPAQERGMRPARPLPYQPDATSRTDCAAGRFYIAMSNAGAAATHLSVQANRFRSDGPWQYDVAPGATVEDYFSVVTYGGGRYDLTATGPNGFERQFTGDLNVGCDVVEVTSSLQPDAGTLTLTYANRGSSPVTFATAATRYRADGPWSDTVAPGATATRVWDVSTMGQGWYALTVTTTADASFSRRFAGHLENGRASVAGLSP